MKSLPPCGLEHGRCVSGKERLPKLCKTPYFRNTLTPKLLTFELVICAFCFNFQTWKKMLSVVENRVSLLINSCLNSFPLLLFLVEVEMAEAETRQSGNSQVLF